jgi:hypothetical protein
LRVSVILLPDAEATWIWRPGATKNGILDKGYNMSGEKIYDTICGIVIILAIIAVTYYFLAIRS